MMVCDYKFWILTLLMLISQYLWFTQIKFHEHNTNEIVRTYYDDNLFRVVYKCSCGKEWTLKETKQYGGKIREGK